jgi:hypothetical protein
VEAVGDAGDIIETLVRLSLMDNLVGLAHMIVAEHLF